MAECHIAVPDLKRCDSTRMGSRPALVCDACEPHLCAVCRDVRISGSSMAGCYCQFHSNLALTSCCVCGSCNASNHAMVCSDCSNKREGICPKMVEVSQREKDETMARAAMLGVVPESALTETQKRVMKRMMRDQEEHEERQRKNAQEIKNTLDAHAQKSLRETKEELEKRDKALARGDRDEENRLRRELAMLERPDGNPCGLACKAGHTLKDYTSSRYRCEGCMEFLDAIPDEPLAACYERGCDRTLCPACYVDALKAEKGFKPTARLPTPRCRGGHDLSRVDISKMGAIECSGCRYSIDSEQGTTLGCLKHGYLLCNGCVFSHEETSKWLANKASEAKARPPKPSSQPTPETKQQGGPQVRPHACQSAASATPAPPSSRPTPPPRQTSPVPAPAPAPAPALASGGYKCLKGHQLLERAAAKCGWGCDGGCHKNFGSGSPVYGCSNIHCGATVCPACAEKKQQQPQSSSQAATSDGKKGPCCTKGHAFRPPVPSTNGFGCDGVCRKSFTRGTAVHQCAQGCGDTFCDDCFQKRL